MYFGYQSFVRYILVNIFSQCGLLTYFVDGSDHFLGLRDQRERLTTPDNIKSWRELTYQASWAAAGQHGYFPYCMAVAKELNIEQGRMDRGMGVSSAADKGKIRHTVAPGQSKGLLQEPACLGHRRGSIRQCLRGFAGGSLCLAGI